MVLLIGGSLIGTYRLETVICVGMSENFFGIINVDRLNKINKCAMTGLIEERKFKFTHTHTHTHTYIYIFIYIYIYIYIYTHTHTQYLLFFTKQYNYRTTGKLMRERKKITWWRFEPATLTTPRTSSV